MKQKKKYTPPTKRELETIDVALRVTFLVLCLFVLCVVTAYGVIRKGVALQISFLVLSVLCSLMGLIYGLFSWAKKILIKKYKLENLSLKIGK